MYLSFLKDRVQVGGGGIAAALAGQYLSDDIAVLKSDAILNWRIFLEIYEEQLATQVRVTRMLGFADGMEFVGPNFRLTKF